MSHRLHLVTFLHCVIFAFVYLRVDFVVTSVPKRKVRNNYLKSPREEKKIIFKIIIKKKKSPPKFKLTECQTELNLKSPDVYQFHNFLVTEGKKNKSPLFMYVESHVITCGYYLLYLQHFSVDHKTSYKYWVSGPRFTTDKKQIFTFSTSRSQECFKQFRGVCNL